MSEPPEPVRVASVHQPVMGTHLALRITARSDEVARAAESAMVAEAARLEAVFTVFDPASELCRWRSGELADAGPELAGLLATARWWQERSGGAFNPRTAVLTDRWRRAEVDEVAPDDDELATLAASITRPGLDVDRSGIDLNAIAKGHVVDRVAALALATFDLDRLVVDAGGDLLHRGAGALRVGVEDPHRPYDNVAPLAVVEVADRAVATSGRARRWFAVGADRHSRVLDPRTGRPVAHAASATVVAPDATTADVLATVASVLAPGEAVAFVDGLAADGIDAACLVVTADGDRHASAGWSALVRQRGEASSSVLGLNGR
ncbi:MAG: FAD:protein FMN transferase [Actinobacteria bacterium]|nr:FAD:protein FMN transferase [Actinomycetota bacterium]